MSETQTQIEPEYQTRHVGLAAFLRYVMPDAHLATTRIGQYSTSFSFSDPEKCKELESAFFSEEGAVTANARELLDCARIIRTTIAKAQRSECGMWEASDSL